MGLTLLHGPAAMRRRTSTINSVAAINDNGSLLECQRLAAYGRSQQQR